MAMELPASPKVYTTTYDNFRGVDFTNDPSNVWTHRSPNAKNMMPDLSGRPWKRTGWKIEVTTQDFKDCYNTATGSSYTGRLVPIKTSYFELGGEDFLAISNNLGLFFYSKFIGGSASDKPYLLYVDGYYQEGGSAKTTASIVPNPNRAFFFEGGGTAGFYIFCTTTDNTDPENPIIETNLFRFDGEKLRITTPKIPKIVIGKGSGEDAGTFYENPNILTLERMVMFTGDGSGKDFILPEKADTGKTITVEVLESGVWVTKTVTTHYSYSQVNVGGFEVTKISFLNAPASGQGEDNIRVTYSIVGSSSTTTTTTKQGSIKVVTKKRQTRTVAYDSGSGAVVALTPWDTKETTYSKIQYSCVIPNIVINSGNPAVTAYMKTDASTWSSTPVTSANLGAKYNAYTDTLSTNYLNPSGYYTTSTENSSITVLSTSVSTATTSKDSIVAQSISVNNVKQQRYVTETKSYPIKIVATTRVYSGSPERTAFETCIRSHVFGDGLINSVFMTGATEEAYSSRVWWSATADPTYFPDTNYFEAGSNDTRIAGLIDVGEYLGVIKQGHSTNSTIYLAYQTKVPSGEITDGNTSTTTYDVTYGVKTSIGGIGAISNGAFNILNGEPLFLSKEGIMGINPLNEADKQIRNRSFFVNKKLTEESDLENAFSFVWRNMYILAVNNHCYVLDGSQKSSWANEKTNLQYECYFWDNIPAQCFARYDGQLWFTDHDGRLCRFKPEGEADSYHDDYDASVLVPDGETPTESSVLYGYIPISWVCDDDEIKVAVDFDTFWDQVGKTGSFTLELSSAGYLHRTHFGHHFGNSGHLDTTATVGGKSRSGDSITTYLHDSEGWHFNGLPVDIGDYGVTILSGDPKMNITMSITVGAPISASWSTVLDDDGSAHYFKTLQKKGTMVVLYPQSSTGVRVYIKKDNEEPKYVGMATVRGSNNEITAPSDFYLKKKAKKYKRLQIITENDGFDETFGIDEIIKCYTVGNYSRNR